MIMAWLLIEEGTLEQFEISSEITQTPSAINKIHYFNWSLTGHRKIRASYRTG